MFFYFKIKHEEIFESFTVPYSFIEVFS